MKNFILSKAVSANQLTSEGVRIEFDQTKSLMKLIVSDQLLKIFECELVEEDYPKENLSTESILEIQHVIPILNFDDKFDKIKCKQTDKLIFGFFQFQLLKRLNIDLQEAIFYKL